MNIKDNTEQTEREICEELYARVERATLEAGHTIEEKTFEELGELIDECEISLRSICKNSVLQNYFELADEIADVTITVDQFLKKDFWKIVQDRRRYKLCRLDAREKEGKLFRE